MIIDFSDIVSMVALFIASYAVWQTHSKNVEEKIQNKTADLGANFVRIGSNSHRLRIFNRGSGIAHNVNIKFSADDDIVSDGDVNQKFPMEALEKGQSVELIAFYHFGSKSKHAIELSWNDENGKRIEKTVYPTV